MPSVYSAAHSSIVTSGESVLRYGAWGCCSSAATRREMNPMPVWVATHGDELGLVIPFSGGREGRTRDRAVAAERLDAKLNVEVALLANSGGGEVLCKV
jgi:hypothetical protein